MSGQGSDFEYDVAVSFAGENRAVVERFANILAARDYRVFYDDWKKADLWGRDLYQHLAEVYSKKARYCVLFLSAQYAAKLWTNHELKSAQERAFRENREYILPVRLDDTAIPGIRETVGYLDLRQHTVEEVAALAAEKLGPAKPAGGKARGKKSAATPAPKPPGGGGKRPAAVVESSGNWILLADAFYEAQSVESPDDKRFVVTLAATDAAADSRLAAIRSQQHSAGRQLSFAYANDAFVVRCESAAATFEGGVNKWRVALIKEDIQYGGNMMEMAFTSGSQHFSAEDFARMRAERILLGSHPAPAAKRGGGFDATGNMVESFIQGSNNPIKVTSSPIRDLAQSMPRTDPVAFLTRARLLSLFYLKAGGVVERVERLTLGPLKADSVRVAFRGLRRKKYSNSPPEAIELEGDCPLP